eukprot:TRINITY_DN383_c0_g2_i2.p1 TRINITY_DN383_c0_g2~~TRINITY_DN383_c0_g2_i2.p1  ORF type:complete len:199 (-),score=3.61 TRINITY_DN383_c0_g2_i2:228-824(-)
MATLTKTMAASVTSSPFGTRLDASSAAFLTPLRSRRPSHVKCTASPSPPEDNSQQPNKQKQNISVESGSVSAEMRQKKGNTKSKTSFGEVMAFSGPAPETINGRLAMIGFVSALGVELWSGRDIFAQINSGNGVEWFAGTAALLTLASLVPLLKGVMPSEQSSSSLMSAEAEMWNGRFAMVGLLALAFTEYVKGGPLV